MDVDYASSACRHLRDAQALCTQHRWDNAIYLAGYVVECAIKAVIDRARLRPLLHVDQMSPDVLLLAADLSRSARRYAIDLDPDVAFVRGKWSLEYRYVPTGTISQREAEELREAGERVLRRTVENLVLDGYLERVPR